MDDAYLVDADDGIFDQFDLPQRSERSEKEASRGTATFFERNGKAMVYKHYRRGGLISKIIEDQYLWMGIKRTRSFIEFRALDIMRELGLSVPRPVAARVNRRKGYYTADLITEEIKDTKTLGDILKDGLFSSDIFSRIGRALKVFHERGCYHPDLNVENILINDEQEIFLLDFDRWKMKKTSDGSSIENINRLNRSILKQSALVGRPFPKEEWAQLIVAYRTSK